LAEACDERGLRPVDQVAGRQEVVAAAQEARLRRRFGRIDAEDRADRDVDVDVRGAVERVDGDGEAAGGVERGGLGELLGGVPADAGASERGAEDVVGDEV
jgi:hypothetical protein